MAIIGSIVNDSSAGHGIAVSWTHADLRNPVSYSYPGSAWGRISGGSASNFPGHKRNRVSSL